MSDLDVYIDRLVLVGLVWVNRSGVVVRQVQLHGRTTAVSESDGIILSVAPDGHALRLPPHLPALTPAPPGTYTEHSSGASIVNPDFISMWEIHEPNDPTSPGDWRPGPTVSFPPPSSSA